MSISDLEPAIAKMLAEGDLDPVTLLPMVDINPRYVPRVLKPLPFVVNGVTRPDKGKGKKAGNIMNFFGQSFLARCSIMSLIGQSRPCCESQGPEGRVPKDRKAKHGRRKGEREEISRRGDGPRHCGQA